MTPEKLVLLGNRPLFSASWGGLKVVPGAVYVYETDEFTEGCAVVLVEPSGITTQTFDNREDATSHLLNFIRLKSLPEPVPDDIRIFENDRVLWDDAL
ncbi:MAG: hypothetical protein PHH28_08425 [Desulfuromonadaceae bacterium]|nr:hypothetical protein [Desulfuromonadaceae bacterium]